MDWPWIFPASLTTTTVLARHGHDSVRTKYMEKGSKRLTKRFVTNNLFYRRIRKGGAN